MILNDVESETDGIVKNTPFDVNRQTVVCVLYTIRVYAIDDQLNTRSVKFRVCDITL